jgi:hypothetical protein
LDALARGAADDDDEGGGSDRLSRLSRLSVDARGMLSGAADIVPGGAVGIDGREGKSGECGTAAGRVSRVVGAVFAVAAAVAIAAVEVPSLDGAKVMQTHAPE